MSRKRGLGKGLDALIPAGVETPATGSHDIPIDRIKPNPRQPRTEIDSHALAELSASIKTHGVLQPLVLMPADSDGIYTLVSGERRLEAARMAGLNSVPAVIRAGSEREQLEWALIENLQREDLNPLEAAEGYRQLAEDFNLSHEAIADRVGKSRAAVTNALRLLKLSAAVRQALSAGHIAEGHARALLALNKAQAQAAALKTVIEKGMNVRQTEELVRKLQGARRKGKKVRPERPPEEAALEDELRQALGTRVTLRRGRRGGSLVIHFYSDEELNALVDQLLKAIGED